MPIAIGALVAIAILSADRAAQSNLFQTIWSFQVIDIADLICLSFVPLLVVLVLVIRRPRLAGRRIATYSVVLALMGIGAIAFMVLYSPTNSTASIAAIAAVAATIGWILQRQAAIDLSRKQHTLNILLQLRQSDLFNRHRTNIFSIFPDVTALTDNDALDIYGQRLSAAHYAVDDAGNIKFPMVESIRYICNYYEFLAAAVYHGDIDDTLLRSSLGAIMESTYNKFEKFMEMLMKMDKKRCPLVDSHYYYFWWLVNRHWK